VANNPEALAQIARLLGEEQLRLASGDEVRSRVDDRLELLADGLIAEAAASDDITDRASALDFLHDRLRFLGDLLTDQQRARLLELLQSKIESW
jgi:hypothetical protein